MTNRIFRASSEPDREHLSWDMVWKGPDRGLIRCWEVGRELAMQNPELASMAKSGGLPALHWKGGLVQKLKSGHKYGCLQYLAQWQGLRGDNLDIDLDAEIQIECSRFSTRVTYTGDSRKYAIP